jgi:hypothetical protein
MKFISSVSLQTRGGVLTAGSECRTFTGKHNISPGDRESLADTFPKLTKSYNKKGKLVEKTAVI